MLVIGLDGATWTLLDPLLEQGKLPNLARLISNGSRAALRSCIQPSSEQAWSAFATGKQNGKFGLFGFYQRAKNSYALEYINASHRRGATLWRILSDRGKRVLVVNVPLTWPVEPVNGALISGLMTPGLNSQFTYPPNLRLRLLEALGEYIIDVDIERGEAGMESLGELATRVKHMSELQTRALKWLMQEDPNWEFAMVMHRAPDILCHKFWRYQDPTHPLYNEREAALWGNVIADAFEYLDAQVGELVDSAADKRTSIIVLSDHGFGALTHAVYLNQFFAERGLLTYRKQYANVLGSLLRTGINQLNHPLAAAFKQRLFELLPQLKSNLHYSMAYGNIEWTATRAYAVGTMGNVYLNVRGREPKGIVAPEDYESARDEVIAVMKALHDPETRQPIFDAVYRREEIYHGDALEEAPDVIGLIDGPYHIAAVDWRDERAPTHNIVEKVGKELLFVSDTSGQHRMDGILVAAGNGFAADAVFAQQPQLIDLAPTILQLLGEAVPKDMDGRVLEELLTDRRRVEFAPAAASINVTNDGYSVEDAKAVEERLAGLGYLG